jgi:chromosome partitioning protein
MILLVGIEKGGAGKSTLATNFAVALAQKGDCVLLDTDFPQHTGAKWAAVREHARKLDPPDRSPGLAQALRRLTSLAPVQVFQRAGDIHDAVKDLACRYDHVVIDAGGRDSPELRSAMLACDVLVSPIPPSQADLWTVKNANEIVRNARALNRRLRAYWVLNRVSTNPRVHEAEDAQELLRRDGAALDITRAIVCDRKSYRDVVAEGLSVLEWDDRKAAGEFENLIQEVLNV